MKCDIQKNMSYKRLGEAGKITEPGNSLNFKTGDWRIIAPKWNKEVCRQCTLCWVVCPENAIIIDKEKQELTHIDYDYCKGCGICAKTCPFKAISMVKTEEIEEKRD